MKRSYSSKKDLIEAGYDILTASNHLENLYYQLFSETLQ
jgi:hypothetical protein